MPWPTYFFLLIRTKNWSSSLDYHTHRFINYRQCDLNESSKFWFLFLPAEKKGFVVVFFCYWLIFFRINQVQKNELKKNPPSWFIPYYALSSLLFEKIDRQIDWGCIDWTIDRSIQSIVWPWPCIYFSNEMMMMMISIIGSKSVKAIW